LREIKELNTKNKEYKDKIETQTEEINNYKKKLLILEYENKIQSYENKVSSLSVINEDYKNLSKDYKSMIENNNTTVLNITNIASKAIDNVGNKIINNTYKSKIINNLLPLTDQYIRENSKTLQLKHVVNGAESLAYYANDNSLKDRVICTDVARRNFVFKDENNNIIKDPKGVKITKKFVDNNKNELVRLLKEYAVKFYELDCPYDYKTKLEIDDCLYAITKGDIPSNSDNYSKFEKKFTQVFSKLVYNKNIKDINDEDSDDEKDDTYDVESDEEIKELE